MRYYDIVVSDPNTGAIKKEWTSHPGGKLDPAALDIVIDCTVQAYGTPSGTTDNYLQIWGISLQDLFESSNYGPSGDGSVQYNIDIYGGMKAGLPLANPAQSGLLVSGAIYQSFGNWQGTDQTLEFTFIACSASTLSPANLIMNWTAGTPLATAIANTLQTAFPKVKQNISISDKLVLQHDEVGFYPTLEQFAQAVLSTTVGVIGSTYPGVQITVQQGEFYVYDVRDQSNPVQINFTDLIGQPTWLSYNTMQFKTVMRADIQVGNYIKMPKGFTGAPGQAAQIATPGGGLRSQSVFQNTFGVIGIRHLGQFRSNDADCWVTVFDCTTQFAGAGS